MDINALIGKEYEWLTVLGLSEKVDKQRCPYLICKCRCGNQKDIRIYQVIHGKTKSCGCLVHRGVRFNPDRITQIKRRMYRKCVSRSKEKNSTQEPISFEEFTKLIELPCHYCGTLPSNLESEKKSRAENSQNDKITDTTLKYSGLDRMNNGDGYTKGNVVPCCKTCNLAKRTMNADEFKEWIAKAFHHLFDTTYSSNETR